MLSGPAQGWTTQFVFPFILCRVAKCLTSSFLARTWMGGWRSHGVYRVSKHLQLLVCKSGKEASLLQVAKVLKILNESDGLEGEHVELLWDLTQKVKHYCQCEAWWTLSLTGAED